MDEYGSHASLYDPVVGPFLRPTHRDMAELVERAGKTVLDICCGTGLFAGIADSTGLVVTGVDLSPAMLNVARENHPHIDFIEHDASQLPLEDNSYDAATICFALHEKPRPVGLAIIREAQRVVRPGGTLVVADYCTPERPSRLTGWAIRCVERLAGREHHAHFKDFMRLGGSDGFFAEAGLQAQKWTTHMSGWSGVYSVIVG